MKEQYKKIIKNICCLFFICFCIIFGIYHACKIYDITHMTKMEANIESLKAEINQYEIYLSNYDKLYSSYIEDYKSYEKDLQSGITYQDTNTTVGGGNIQGNNVQISKINDLYCTYINNKNELINRYIDTCTRYNESVSNYNRFKTHHISYEPKEYSFITINIPEEQ